MSFDRPHYLERVLQTVAGQLPMKHTVPDYYMFQDGSISPRTGLVYGNAALMAESVKVFQRYLPQGRVFDSEVNLGVAMNFDRAERTLFEENGYDAAIFLEDDLLLQPHYFQVMEEMLNLAGARDDIGMVTALGYQHHTPLAEQRARVREVRLMDEHNWAFGMRREAWAARDRALRPYLDLVADLDYRERDKGDRKQALKALQQSLSRHGAGYLTSQDSMKNMAFELLGRHRVTTFTNNARYIGKEGEHSTAEKFAARGYDRTVMYDRPHGGFEIPPPDDLRRMRVGLQYR
jgi:hypothetical protein